MRRIPIQRSFYLRAILYWIILAIVTIVFAVFREAVFIPVTGLGETLARAILLPVAIVYIFIVTRMFLMKTKVPYKSSNTLLIGLLWVVLTIVFEFTFGTLVMGNSLPALLADYNLFAGRTWSIFLVAMFLAPFIVHKLYKEKDA